MADKRNHCRTKSGKRKQNAQSEGCGQSKLFKRSGSCGQGSDNAALHRMALIHALNLQHPHVGRVNAPRPQRTCDLHMLHEGCLQALKHVWNCSSLSHKLVQNLLQKHATPTPAAHNLISVFFSTVQALPVVKAVVHQQQRTILHGHWLPAWRGKTADM